MTQEFTPDLVESLTDPTKQLLLKMNFNQWLTGERNGLQILASSKKSAFIVSPQITLSAMPSAWLMLESMRITLYAFLVSRFPLT